MFFHDDTPQAVRDILNKAANSSRVMRLRIWYGSSDGKAWLEGQGVIGYVGQSAGPQKFPLLMATIRSSSGEPIVGHRIIRIDEINSRKTLYVHDSFRVPYTVLAQSRYFTLIDIEKNLITSHRFRTKKEADIFLKFMRGERYRR